MTSSYAQLRRPGAGAIGWRKAEAEREHKRRHAAAITLERERVGALCLDTTSDVLDIPVCALLSRCRLRRWKNARHIAMTVACELSGLSTVALGKLFNRDRNMILYAQRRVNTNPELRAQADRVVRAVKKELRRK